MANKTGRKNAYEEKILPKLALIEGWARDGLTNEQIAKNLGISRTTFQKYAKDENELSEHLKRGKEISDYMVENELFKKATGFTQKEKRLFKIKEVEYENGKRKREKERIEEKEVDVYYPPELGAQVFWLKNRRPNKWRDKQEVHHEADENTTGVVILAPVKDVDD